MTIHSTMRVMSCFCVAISGMGCSKEIDIFVESRQAIERANALTDALLIEGSEIREGGVVAGSGPRLDSYFTPLRLIPGRGFRFDITGADGIAADAVVLHVEDADRHLVIPIELIDGVTTVEGALADASELIGRRHITEIYLSNGGEIGNQVPTSLIIKAEPDEFDFQMRTLAAHPRGAVEAVAFPNGLTSSDTIATGASDGIVTVWDLVTGRQQLSFSGHDARIFALAMTSGGDQIVSGAQDGGVRFWDANTGALDQERTDHTDAVKSIALSPDDATVATASWDGTVRLWNTDDAVLLRTIELDSRANDVAFSPDGLWMAVGTGRLTLPGSVVLYDVSTWSEVWRISTETDVSSLAFAPDSTALVAAFGRGNLDVYNIDGIRLRALPDAPRDTVEDVGFPSRLPGIVMGLTLSGRMTFWRWTDGEVVARRRADNEMFAFSLSPDGARIGLGTGLGVAWVAEVEDLAIVP